MKNSRVQTKKIVVILLVIGMAWGLSGCARLIDSEGHTLAEKIIYLSTTWGDIWKTDGLLTFLIVYPLAQCINFLSQYMNVALAIIVTTLLFNLIILKFSIKSTVSSQRMAVLQPEMAKIQKKYEGKRDQRSQMLMANELDKLYKKYDVNPISTMVMPFLQLPIMISMYYAVQRADAVVNGTLFGLPLITTPHQAMQLNTPQGWSLFAIFVLMGIAQFSSSFVTQWLAKRKNLKDHKVKSYDKAATDNSMQYVLYGLLLMILVMGFNWPTAMSLYWLISSVVNLAKTIYIQRRYIDNV